jgi:hypothetical protein
MWKWNHFHKLTNHLWLVSFEASGSHPLTKQCSRTHAFLTTGGRVTPMCNERKLFVLQFRRTGAAYYGIPRMQLEIRMKRSLVHLLDLRSRSPQRLQCRRFSWLRPHSEVQQLACRGSITHKTITQESAYSLLVITGQPLEMWILKSCRIEYRTSR